MSALLQPASNTPAPSAAEVMSARTSERSINVELPTQQAIFAPQPSVHALKPLTKILSFGPSVRKPLKAEPWAPAPAWSTDVKSRSRGLIGAETAGFFQKRKGGWWLAWCRTGHFFPQKTALKPF